MAAKNYELKIRKMQEGKEIYYLGSIDGLTGFLVEGETIEKVKELAPFILKDYLEAVEEMKKVNQFRKKLQFSLQTA
ncbi:hypothetical protein [Chryseobacterium oryctis]|uniref:HicB family protein n=1 Tax=Chryseobacterium oryctis TaxID=2952618 RepID=A0ABT3HIQ8_9FLAO|nr:hypothetical protein [Chryseobacterium oryctis]MCW3159664.1 hypothetical protein [Chryseobacterium oryctis]